MKHYTILALLLVSTSLHAGSTFADTSSLTQYGINDEALIVQVPDATANNTAIIEQGVQSENVKATIRQSGKNSKNTARIYQTGTNDTAYFTQAGSGTKYAYLSQPLLALSTSGNNVTLTQSGSADMIAAIDQGYFGSAFNNTINIIQRGEKIDPSKDANKISVLQSFRGTADHNEVTLTQNGQANLGRILQGFYGTLDNSKISLVQTGDTNQSDIYQHYGSRNNSSTLQLGQDNKSQILQNGLRDNHVTLQQDGKGNKSDINQQYSSINDTVSLVQKGNDNNAIIFQNESSTYDFYYNPNIPATHNSVAVNQKNGSTGKNSLEVFQGSAQFYSPYIESENVAFISQLANTGENNAILHQGTQLSNAQKDKARIEQVTLNGSNNTTLLQGDSYSISASDTAIVQQTSFQGKNTTIIAQGTNQGRSQGNMASVVQNANTGSNTASILQSDGNPYRLQASHAMYDVASITQNGGENAAEINQGIFINTPELASYTGDSSDDHAAIVQNGNSNTAQVNQGRASISDHAYAAILQTGQGNSAIVSQATAQLAVSSAR